MPTYVFKCGCGKTREVVCMISDRPEELLCGCGGAMERDWKAELIPMTDKCELYRGHSSEALAVDPRDIPEAMETDRRMGVSTEGYTKEGSPIFSSYRQKKAYAKAHGFHFNNSYS
jgi:hypothetical protein